MRITMRSFALALVLAIVPLCFATAPVQASKGTAELRLSEFHRQNSGQYVKPIGGLKFNLDCGGGLSLNLDARRAFDRRYWVENRLAAGAEQKLGHGAFMALDFERYYDRNDNRLWATVGTRLDWK